jgi:hypothetical protein
MFESRHCLDQGAVTIVLPNGVLDYPGNQHHPRSAQNRARAVADSIFIEKTFIIHVCSIFHSFSVQIAI